MRAELSSAGWAVLGFLCGFTRRRRTGSSSANRTVTSGRTDRMECVNLLLLILVSMLSHTVRAAKKTLDMAPNAVDDVFSGCRNRMLKAVMKQDGLLMKELQNEKKFKEMWNTSGGCNKTINGLYSVHQISLQSYGNSGTKTRKTFNDKVYESGSNATTYKNEFPFKSLHFLLTDTLQYLNNGKQCNQVYYGTNNQYTAKPGTEIRFGKFLQPGNKKSSEEEKIMDDGTLFDITSCSVVSVENYTCLSEEVELLMSPNEVFSVENVQYVSNDDGYYTMITLKHSRFLSNHDCYLFDGTPSGSSSPLLSPKIAALVASILSLYYCTAPQ